MKKINLPEDNRSPVVKIETHLKRRLIGQDRPIREISRSLERALSGLNNPNRPIATLAFFGPTGIGKTLSAKELTNCFRKRKVWRCTRYRECQFQITAGQIKAGMKRPEYCPKHQKALSVDAPLEAVELDNIWTIDCGGMSGSLDHAVTTLIGSPPSYVGHDTPPLFAGGKAPRVVLFDEAEKALLTTNWRGGGSAFSAILLKILDEGRIRNNHGEEIDFTDSIIILTGNLGAAEIIREFEGQSIGFRSPEGGRKRKKISEMTDQEIDRLNQRIYKIVKDKAERTLAPELLNRLDRLVVFQFLKGSHYEQILDLEFAKIQEQINKNRKGRKFPRFQLELSASVKKILLEEALSDRQFGARPIIRIIEKRVITPLSALINNQLIKNGDLVQARLEQGSIVFYQEPSQASSVDGKEEDPEKNGEGSNGL